MMSTRFSLIRSTLAVAVLAMAFPALAGTLSPQLRALAESYHRAPQTAVVQARKALVTHGAFGLASPHVSADGRVQVYLHFRPGSAPGTAALDGLDASGVLVSRRLAVVQAWVPIAALHTATRLADVTRVTLPVYAFVKGGVGVQPRKDSCSAVSPNLNIDAKGIAAQNIKPVHQAGVDGTGVKVGIISEGVDCLSSSQNAGYLPANVTVYAPAPSSGDEGTAMLEIVHAAAPGATLGFCSPNTTVDFLQCYDDFLTWGANIIADDLGFFPVSSLSNFENGITSFARNHPDINLVTSAGNDRDDFFGHDYVATTNPTSPGGPPITLSPTYATANGGAANRSYQSAMVFHATASGTIDAAEKVTLGKGNTLYGDLTWDDPANGPYDDLDLFLLKNDGSVACSPNADQFCASTWDQKDNPPNPSNPNWYPPGEFVQYTNNTGSNQTLYLVVYCFECTAHGAAPLHIKLYGHMNGGGVFNYVTNGGVAGHAGLAAMLTTAAARYSGSGVNSRIESFSDSGPFFYGDWLNGTQTRSKPDVTGIDGVTVSGAGGFSSPFYGTSAASPNVASVLALARSAFPNGRPDAAHWKQLVMDQANSSALTNYTRETGGTGLVDAQATLAGVDGPMTPKITAPAGSPFNVNPNTDVAFQGNCGYSGQETLSYKWTFGGDSGIPDSTKLTPDPVQYANGGIYTVKFTCSDKYQSKTAQKTVAVQAAAHADDQSISTAYEQSKNGRFTGSGIGGEQVKYVVVRKPAHGTVQSSGASSFVYTPDNGYSGSDSFTFDIDNGVMTSNTATVTVSVGPKPKPPSSGGGGALGLSGLAVLFGLAGLLAVCRRR